MMYPFRLEYWTADDGLGGANAFIKRLNGRIFSTSGGLVTLSPDRRRWIPLPGASRLSGISTLEAVDKNRLLAAALNGLAVLRMNGKLVAQTRAGGGADEWLVRTAGGQLYLGGDGISRVILRANNILLRPEPVPAHGVLAMRYDRARDILWACDGKELFFRQAGQWRALSHKDGLIDAKCDAIGIDRSGDLWIGYQTAVYSLIHQPLSGQPLLHNYHRGEINDPIANNAVRFLSPDSWGRIWRGNNYVFVASPDGAVSDNWIRLDEQDGINELVIPSDLFADEDGSVWTATEQGITHFAPPADFTSNFPQPQIFVSSLSSGRNAPQLVDAIERLPHNTAVTAQLGSLQFDRRNSLHFRYRLLPAQGGWKQTDALKLDLGRPQGGKHTLQVQAQLSTGPWSDITEQSFTILPPVWLTWPYLLGYILTGGVVVTSGHRLRKRRNERAAKLLPELAEWRLAALSPELSQLGGTMLDHRFEVGRVLARGGFATVAEGRDLQEGGRPCAIKLFRQELMDKAWMARRFQQEVRALAKVTHPNVVRIYSHGETATGAAYLVMEFIDGNTLREVLEEGCLAPLLTASYLRQIGAALDAIHAHGICHRDLKPENLMIRRAADWGREVVLIDFSIAIVKDPDETLHGLSRAAGTIYYMAPEQAIGYADSSTDIYSLAKILIEMLTGKRLSELLPDASMDLPERVRELLAGLPLELSSASIDVVGSALEFDPARRPRFAGQFAHQIAEDLEQVASRK
jgi:hypothetical protein